MLNWFRQLDDARTTDQVIAIARDYFASWTPEELGRLPRDCRPGRMKSERDLEDLHVCVVEEFGRSEATGDDLATLQRLTSFVVRASVRSAQLAGEDDAAPEPPPGPANRSAASRKAG